jgi:hypothetical protein
MFAPGEKERYEQFFVSRGNRIAKRAELETAMAVSDPQPYIDVQGNFEALVLDASQRRQAPEPEFEDSKVVKNHNIW